VNASMLLHFLLSSLLHLSSPLHLSSSLHLSSIVVRPSSSFIVRSTEHAGVRGRKEYLYWNIFLLAEHFVMKHPYGLDRLYWNIPIG
jgi:hypothetical protein